MDNSQKLASENKPYGYVRVFYGPIRPDDLLWSAFEAPPVFRRADDPDWNGKPLTDASDATYCIRIPRHQIEPGQSVRHYKISRVETQPAPDVVKSSDAHKRNDQQPDLFG